jgi:hypothetical protein
MSIAVARSRYEPPEEATGGWDDATGALGGGARLRARWAEVAGDALAEGLAALGVVAAAAAVPVDAGAAVEVAGDECAPVAASPPTVTVPRTASAPMDRVMRLTRRTLSSRRCDRTGGPAWNESVIGAFPSGPSSPF